MRPDLATPVVCRVPHRGSGEAEPATLTPADRKNAPTVPAVGCSLSVVRLVVFLPASLSIVNTNTKNDLPRLLQHFSVTPKLLGLPRHTRSNIPSCIFLRVFYEVAPASS